MKLKEKYTVDYIESNDLVLLKTLVGSYSQNLQTEKSDKDYIGIFQIKKEDYNSLEYKLDPFDTVISNNPDYDITYIEYNKFITLLYNNNPNALEILASSKIDGNWVKKSGYIDKLDINKILSKKCLDTFGKYASSQIKKATGLNKKMNNPIPIKKKTLLDFCYLYGNPNYKNSTVLTDVIEDLDINQKFFGLRPIKNCKSTYQVYCDYHSWLCFGEDDIAIQKRKEEDFNKEIFKFAKFKGVIHPEKFSPQIRISDIPYNENNEYFIVFVGYIYYNLEGYETYLKDYKQYREWVEKRNPERYKNNIGQKYDVKNLAHCARLLTVAKEIGEGKGLILKRTDDKDLFIDIKLGKVDYKDILYYSTNIIDKLAEIYTSSNLPDECDFNYLNNLMIEFNGNKK
jgi:uncharacterized protein